MRRRRPLAHRILAEVTSKLVEHATDESQSAEMEVLDQIAAGCSIEVVAGHLQVSENTGKGLVRNFQ
jgi:DNA-binding NarL/FixJ family response regulator